MKISLEQIRDAALGAAWVSEEAGDVRLHRFTEEQEKVYIGGKFESKAWATAGICLSFQTDSPWLSVRVTVSQGSSRNFFNHEIFVDGKRTGCFGNLDGGPEYKLEGTFGGRFGLGEGSKQVRIVFPWSVASVIQCLELEDGASFLPVRPGTRTVFFGDSITHGYDARFPSGTYMMQISALLETEGFNKAIGGERFCPALAQCRDDFTPDRIFTAYGTNDWSGLERAVLEQNCREFFRALHENYPQTPVYALTPIWRKDLRAQKPAGAFEDVAKIIREMTAPYEHMTVIDGFDFVPHEESYYSDRRLHPNDEGFRFYTENLWKAIRELG